MAEPCPPRFTILVPSYNQAVFLPEALDSLMAQTCPDWEAVVVDDGSTDGTRRVLEVHAARDPRIRPFHQANGGVAAALNGALAQAKGEWICWLSSDDMLEPDALDVFADAMEAAPKVQFFHSDLHELVHETGQRRPGPANRAQTLPPRALQTLTFFDGNYVHGISICVKKAMFDRVGPFNVQLRYAQDMDMWLRMSALTELRFLDRRTCVTRLHARQGTHEFPEAGILDSARACLDFLNRHPFEALFPHLDLSTGEGVTEAVQATLRVALNLWACMYAGVGAVPALLERLGVWLFERCPRAFRTPLRKGLRALESELGSIPEPLRDLIHRMSRRDAILYLPKDALALMKTRRLALEGSGERAEAALLKRYLEKT
jgi:glycosyltransferase involved in cell wall biosynthesis